MSKLKEYKVIALSVGGMSNKVHSCGDIVNEKHFHEGHAELLVKSGFLSPIGSEKEENSDPLPITEDSSAKEIKAALTIKGIDFSPSMNKKDAYALWLQSEVDDKEKSDSENKTENDPASPGTGEENKNPEI